MSDTTATLGNAHTTKMPGILGGAMILAGTSIGAGMFALPVLSAGMWFSVSIVMLLLCAFCAYSSGLYLAESGMNYRDGANYNTIAEDTLGPIGKLVATGTVAFVSYILCYAYISGGSSIVSQTAANAGFTLPHSAAAIIFAVAFACIVLAGSRMVDRVSTIMLGGMVITFFGSAAMMTGSVSSANLLPLIPLAESSTYIWIAVPMLITSFGFHSTVLSLIKHYQRDVNRVRQAILLGSAVTLTVYVVWQLIIMGNVSRDSFTDIIAQGGNVATLISAVGQSTNVTGVESALMVFGNLALASSFVGVSLGLVDLVKDTLKLEDNLQGTIKAGAITFLPPAILGTVAPNGFITAIGFAALAASVFVMVLPPMMAKVLRKRGKSLQYQANGGMVRINLVLGFGILGVLLEVAHLAGVLPQFG